MSLADETTSRGDFYSGGVIGIFGSAILYVMALNGVPETLQTRKEPVMISSRSSREEIDNLVWSDIPYDDSKIHRKIAYRRIIDSKTIWGRGLRINQP